jgi:ribosomal protein S18 acetylase RimI-like enzyme
MGDNVYRHRDLWFFESPDYESRVDLVSSAFENPGYSQTNLRGLIASPDYVDDYHLSVVSPDRQHVAYCVGWLERANANAGYIEPVGTHQVFRQRGFAKAVIKECFKRMKGDGVHTGQIASRAEPTVANFLYDSLSPSTRREVHKYKKLVRR